MFILSVDSSTSAASAALSEDERLIAFILLNVGTKHSTTLMPAVSQLLKFAGIGAADIGLFALCAGPGSFTGVRIGAASVKGMALGRNVPCIGVSTTAVMAEALGIANGIVCPLIAARHDRYFTAFFSAESGRVTRLTGDDVLEGTAIEEYLSGSGANVYLCGDGAAEFSAGRSIPGLVKVPETYMYPSAYYAGMIAFRRFTAAGEDERREFTAENLRAVYLRPPQAERTRIK